MPIILDVDRSKGLTVFTGTGDITPDDISSTVEMYYSNDPTDLILWDLRNASLVGLTPEFIQDLAQSLQHFRQARKGRTQRRTAIVTNSDFVFGMARMLEITADITGDETNVSMMIFRDLEKASRWLEEATYPGTDNRE